MKYLILVLILIAGCSPHIGPKVKCVDGITYVEENGAWVNDRYYKDSKCLPMEPQSDKKL